MALPRPAGPRTLLADLRAFTRERPRHQWFGLIAAIAMPVIIIYGFYRDSQTNIAPGEQLIYAESWTGNRTDAEILAAQKERQARLEATQAERQRQFKKLEQRFGMK
ncbi:MAG TPA: hypothetical protein VF628_11940 [Allosphingosinicella sp.]|jgi:hypothetical protein